MTMGTRVTMRNQIRTLFWNCAALGAAGLLFSSPALGVIVDGSNGTGTANVMQGTEPPVTGSAKAGKILGFSGVYVGNRWALTASHIAANSTIDAGTPFTLVDGRTFNTDQSSVRLTNPSDHSVTDLLLVHLGGDPGLSNLNIASAAPSLGSKIYAMGNGLSRGASDGLGYSEV